MGDNETPHASYIRKIEVLEAALAGCQQRTARAVATSIVAHAPVATAVLDTQMHYVAANAAWLENHGLVGQDLQGQSHYALFPDLPPAWYEIHRRCLAGEVLHSEADSWTRADGRRYWLRWSIYPWYDGEGACAGIVISSEDITQQRQEQASLQTTLEHLQEQQQYLQMMLDNLPIVLFAIDSDRRFTLGEGRGMRMLGLEPGQTVGMSVDDLYADNPQVLGYVNRALAGEAFKEESYLPGLDMYFENHYAPVYDEAGQLRGTLGVAYDISERKRNQRKLERAQHLAKMGEFTFDIAKNSSLVSPELFAIYGLPVADSLSLDSIRDLLSAEEFIRVEQAFALTLKTGVKQTLEYRITTPAGDVRDVYSTWEAITDGQGAIIQVFGTVQDISESKAIMRQLEAKSQQLHAILSNLPVVLFMLDTQGVFTLSEGKGLEALGLQPGAHVDEPFFEVYTGQSELLMHVQRALEGHVTNFTLDIFGLSYESYYTPWYDASGQLSGMLGVAYDITAIKRAQSDLERAQRLAGTGSFAIDLQDYSIRASSNALLMHGFAPDAQIVISDLAPKMSSADFQHVQSSIAQAVQEQRPVELDYILLLPEGLCRDIIAKLNVTVTSQGTVSQVFGTVQDVTERKRIEQALHEKQQLLEDAQRIGQLGAWNWDVTSDSITWSEQTYATFQVPKDYPITWDFVMSLYVDAKPLEQAVSQALEQQQQYDLELEIITMQGEHRWLRVIGTPIVDNGHVVRLVGTQQDISNIKNAQLALQANNRHLARLNDLSQQLQRAETIADMLAAVATSLQGQPSLVVNYLSYKENEPQSLQVEAVYNGHFTLPLAVGTSFPVAALPLIGLYLQAENNAVFISDIHEDARVDAYARQVFSSLGIYGHGMLILRQAEHIVALLGINWSTPQHFSAEEQRYLQALPALLAPIIAKRQALDDLAQSNQRLALLNRVGSQLKAAQGTAAMLEAVLEPLLALLSPDTNPNASLLYVMSDGHNRPESLYIVASQPNHPALPIGSSVALRDFPSSSLWIDDPETVLVIDDVAQDPRVHPSERQVFLDLGVATLVVVPLFQASQWVGLLLLSYPQPRLLSANERSYLEALPAMLTPPLANRRLLENLEETVSLRSKQLEESRRLLRATIDNASSAIFAKDLTGRYILANARLAQLAATSTAAIIGQHDNTVFSPEVVAILQHNDNQVIAQAQAITFEERLPTSEGMRIFSAIKFPLIDDDGHVFAIGGISTDVTEERQKEAEMQAYRDQLAKAQTELQITQRIQELLLPDVEELRAIHDLNIASYMQPAEEVGGDYYDVLRIGEHIKIGIGDVTGHGLESGLLMLMTQAAVRTLFSGQESDPKVLMNTLNRTVFDSLQRMRVDKSLTLALLDYHQGRLRFSGQHEYMLVMRADAVEVIDTMDLGMPLGLEEDISRFIAEQEVNLQPGDGVILFTDGITEAENAEGEQFGLPRLVALAEQHSQASADAIVAAIISALDAHVAGAKVYDDVTLLILKRPLLNAQQQPQVAKLSLSA